MTKQEFFNDWVKIEPTSQYYCSFCDTDESVYIVKGITGEYSDSPFAICKACMPYFSQKLQILLNEEEEENGNHQ